MSHSFSLHHSCSKATSLNPPVLDQGSHLPLCSELSCYSQILNPLHHRPQWELLLLNPLNAEPFPAPPGHSPGFLPVETYPYFPLSLISPVPPLAPHSCSAKLLSASARSHISCCLCAFPVLFPLFSCFFFPSFEELQCPSGLRSQSLSPGSISR